MDVVHMTRAIGEAGIRIEKRRTDDVTELDTGMIFTVPKSRQFNQALEASCCRTELLRKNGVRNADVLEFVSTVSDAKANFIGFGQIVFEIRTNSLNRRSVHWCSFEWRTNALYPYSSDQSDTMVLQQAEDSVEEADGMPSLSTGELRVGF